MVPGYSGQAEIRSKVSNHQGSMAGMSFQSRPDATFNDILSILLLFFCVNFFNVTELVLLFSGNCLFLNKFISPHIFICSARIFRLLIGEHYSQYFPIVDKSKK